MFQNKIVLPTTAPVSEQRDALFRRVGEMVEAAGRSGVNVLCLQEAWSKLLPLNFISVIPVITTGQGICLLYISMLYQFTS